MSTPGFEPTVQTPVDALDPLEPPPGPPDDPLRDQRKWWWAIGGLGAAIALVAAILAVRAVGDPDEKERAIAPVSTTEPGPTTTTLPTTTTTTPSTTAQPSTTAPPTTAAPTTTAPPATTTTTAPPQADPDLPTAVWPGPASDTRFDDPVDAARSFAEDYVGFATPVVGQFQEGDSRSGEVEVRPRGDGPVTTVFVRQLTDDDSWWVTGATTEHITVDEPEAGDTVSSPVHVAGQAHAFEGTVVIEVREQGSTDAIGDGVVTGGGDQPRPFEGDVEFSDPGEPYGAIVFFTTSAENGEVWEATVLPLTFG